MTNTVVSSGQSVTGQNVASGDGLTVFGTATSSTVSGGGILSVSSGGSGFETLVLSGGEIDVASGGVVSNSTLSSGTETVSSGGMASGTTILSGGSGVILGTDNAATVSSGGLEIIS